MRPGFEVWHTGSWWRCFLPQKWKKWGFIPEIYRQIRVSVNFSRDTWWNVISTTKFDIVYNLILIFRQFDLNPICLIYSHKCVFILASSIRFRYAYIDLFKLFTNCVIEWRQMAPEIWFSIECILRHSPESNLMNLIRHYVLRLHFLNHSDLPGTK